MTDQNMMLTLIDALVAIGTLGLAVLTVYQLRLFIQERKANQARELAERVYTPLRMEVTSWTKPENVFGGVSSNAWKELKEKAPYLTLRTPRDLAVLLDATEPLLKRINFLSIQVRTMIHEETNRLCSELCAKVGVTHRGLTMIRVLGRRELITQVDLGIVWCMKLSLKEWAENYVKGQYPVDYWEVEILNGSDRVGGLNEAEEMAEKVFVFLKSQSFGGELLDKIYEIKELAEKTVSRIDAELSRPVSPWE